MSELLEEKKGPRVLVLDDDVELCGLVGSILADQNFEVITFTDPLEALEKIHQVQPDLVISDINMAKMDGFAFRESLSEDDRFRILPFIFLTARRHPDDKIEGLMSGVDAYMTKPFLPRELVATVQNIMKRVTVYRSAVDIDPLTKSYGRSYLNRLPELIEKAHKAYKPVACAILDVDHFRQINDSYGHDTGDLVLSTLAEIIRKSIRKDDVLIRYSGEEFLLFLPGHDPLTAFGVVEKIRRLIAGKVFLDITGKRRIHVTISCGLSDIAKEQSIDDAIHQADCRLYAAKGQGCDRTAAAL